MWVLCCVSEYHGAKDEHFSFIKNKMKQHQHRRALEYSDVICGLPEENKENHRSNDDSFLLPFNFLFNTCASP